ncbi:GNAT family N-acetyltransferase [bacterium]|nr:GNAT family N-acetyltransferase [bacterium]
MFSLNSEDGLDSVFICRADKDDIGEIIDLSARLAVYSVSDVRKADYSGLAERRREDLAGLYDIIYDDSMLVFAAKGPDGRVLGDIIVKLDNIEMMTGKAEGWLIDLSLEPDFWGSGIAGRLLEAAEDEARKRGMAYLGLTVTTANARAVNFYYKMGYIKERIQMFKELN